MGGAFAGGHARRNARERCGSEGCKARGKDGRFWSRRFEGRRFGTGSSIEVEKEMAHENEQDITNRRNVPRFFVEHPHISWMFLAGAVIWGWLGYKSIPQGR